VPSDVNTIVANMVRAQAENRAQHTAYEVVRNYRVFHPDETPAQAEKKSQVTALVSFLPPHSKSYKIEQSTGGIVERVVRNTLQREVELTKDPTPSDLNPENYEFQLLGQELLQGSACYVIALNPKRESKDLLRGKAWVDARTFLIRRVEGEPAKNLSWWIRDVHVTLTYNNVDGMWLRTASNASAHVRFSGDVSFVSRDVDFRKVEYVAALSPPAVPAMQIVSHRTKSVVRPRHWSVVPGNVATESISASK
jgi:hypothetical protein